MTSVRQRILDELTGNTGWQTTAALVKKLKFTKESTIHRALRELRWKAQIISQTVTGDVKKRKEWKLLVKPGTVTGRVSTTAAAATPNNFHVIYGGAQSGTPTYGGATLMNAPQTKPSLVKAVGDLVTQEFIANNTKFSAHDVTKKLRDLVLVDDKLVDMTETGPCWVQGKQVARIEHDDVKNIVHDLFTAGLLTGYGRSYNGSFLEYDLLTNISPPAAVLADDDTDDGDGTIAAPTAVTNGDDYDGSSTI